MMLKTQVELITGFIGAGKTTWINLFLQLTAVADEKIVILQLEKGQEVLKKNLKLQADITYLAETGDKLTLSYLKNLLILYEPDRLLIECNGMKMLEEITVLLEEAEIKKKAYLGAVFNLVEAPSFQIYWQNLKPILKSSLSRSHMIIVTKTHQMQLGEEKELQRLLEQENKLAHILFVGDTDHMELTMAESSLFDTGWPKKMKVIIVKQLKNLLSYTKGGRG